MSVKNLYVDNGKWEERWQPMCPHPSTWLRFSAGYQGPVRRVPGEDGQQAGNPPPGGQRHPGGEAADGRDRRGGGLPAEGGAGSLPNPEEAAHHQGPGTLLVLTVTCLVSYPF